MHIFQRVLLTPINIAHMEKKRVLPWNEFIHDSIEAVVQITAGQMKVHQRFEQVYPAKARTVFNIA